MRILTFRTAEGTRAGRVDGEEVVEARLRRRRCPARLRAGLAPRRRSRRTGAAIALADLDLAPVIVAPRKIICLGLNYAAHVTELGRDLPAYPTLFAKFARCLIGARDPIVLPTDKVDWEAELAVVIGSEVRHAGRAEAGAAIAGYTVCNDISVRDYQNRTLEWLQGKTFENSTPLGPWLVTAEEVVADPADTPDLAISCEVDGDVRQNSRTSDVIFGPAAIIEYVSRIVTLEPGDVISTGTPGGVGIGRTPKVFLTPGQVVHTSIEGIGDLVNECVSEK